MEGHINLRIQPWLRRFLTRLLAILPAMFTILYFGDSALGKLIILSQVVLSLQLGFAVVPLIIFTSDRAKMGQFTISKVTQVFAWLSAAIIIGLNGKLVVEQIADWMRLYPQYGWWFKLLVIPLAVAIAGLLLHILIKPLLFNYHDKPARVPHGFAMPITNFAGTAYQHVGITIDFTANDSESIRHGLMQGGHGAQYTLIHVVETAAARYLGTEVLDHETLSDKANLDKYVHLLQAQGYNAHAHIGYGGTANAITHIVKQEGVDFLVMGAHGHKTLKDMIFGTTVDTVRHKLGIPILIIKANKQ